MGGRAWPALALAGAPSGSVFDEDLFVPTGGLGPASGGSVSTSSGEHPVAGAASDHASPRSPIRSAELPQAGQPTLRPCGAARAARA